MVAPYPLAWPSGWKRTPQGGQQSANFSRKVHEGSNSWASTRPVDLSTAKKRLQTELERLGAVAVTISSNLEALNRREPADPGVAVYFTFAGNPTVLACDKWNRVADNLTAIAKHIDAMRGMDRWGVGSAERAFAAYSALPPPTAANRPLELGAPKPWHEVLGLAPTASKAEINMAWRLLSLQANGESSRLVDLNVARDQALRECEPAA